MARKRRYEEGAPKKAGAGPRVMRYVIRTRFVMAAANFSPAVASRRFKFDGNFRVPTLLGAQPLDHTACASPTRHEKYRQGSRTLGGSIASTRAPKVRSPSARQDAQAWFPRRSDR